MVLVYKLQEHVLQIACWEGWPGPFQATHLSHAHRMWVRFGVAEEEMKGDASGCNAWILNQGPQRD